MSKADLALAAARTRLLVERLDDARRSALIEEWSALLDANRGESQDARSPPTHLIRSAGPVIDPSPATP